ncbi:hypothetical protein CAL29_15140 [Bordetella genomosp. 10]|uniref:Cell division protein n=1 Tax=Bordetella genomosp. 10 TaxID=1416804 RepID=A0A261SCJ9_9BORD|nr:hypothetical protein [Bordetella genomosp. 10]OZI34801.1 hypothetical protein CAL29_15140 [Bordetella genomosp. 10]
MSHSSSRLRRVLVAWLYAVALGHLAVSLFLTWGGHAAVVTDYLATVGHALRPDAAPAQEQALQRWWLALFGATLQSYSLFMLALVHLGNTLRAPAAWLGLMAGVLLWAPQDMHLSIASGVWINLWFDAAALLVLLPPLAWLYRHDRRCIGTSPVSPLPHRPDHG